MTSHHESISIRREVHSDVASIRSLNELAFGQPDEADIVDALRRSGCDLLSFVALHGKSIIGHAMFSPVILECDTRIVEGNGLGPVAVLPDYQQQGIGSALIETGLTILRQRSCPFVIVLGHPSYYPRFGFELASKRGIECQWEGIPDEAFLIQVFDEAVLLDVQGVARYRPEFG